jgi:TonB family protein
MTRTDDKTAKEITLHWRNFVIVVVFIFLVGIIIGLVITPQPEYRAAPRAEPGGAAEADRAKAPLYADAAAEGRDMEHLPPVPLTDKDTPPRLIRQVNPEFPEAGGTGGPTGEMALRITTDRTGRVAEVEILNPHSPEVDRAVLEAVRQWVYEPVFIEGRPRGVIFIVRLPLERP